MPAESSSNVGLSGLVHINGGTFRMGSEDFYPEERPVLERTVPAFRIGRAPVTNAEFAAFVDDTGYQTIAERPLDAAQFPGMRGADLLPGSLVFTPTASAVDLRDWRQWWRWAPGANWRHPFGPDSGIQDKDEHPVVQVAHEDAVAYCEWAGCRLPTEVEWEFAARGGLDGAVYAWGDELPKPDALEANTWQGNFPYRNTGANGWVGTSPVGTFPPNGYGLVDVTGNVWEWTSTPWTESHEASVCGCSPESRSDAGAFVTKGGSHLCAPEYCLRYRPAARSRQTPDSATTHIGFRVASDVLF